MQMFLIRYFRHLLLKQFVTYHNVTQMDLICLSIRDKDNDILLYVNV